MLRPAAIRGQRRRVELCKLRRDALHLGLQLRVVLAGVDGGERRAERLGRGGGGRSAGGGLGFSGRAACLLLSALRLGASHAAAAVAQAAAAEEAVGGAGQ